MTWNYATDNAAIQFLAAGQSLTQTYAVAINDGKGGTTTQNVTVTVFGANDAPVLNAANAVALNNEAAPGSLASNGGFEGSLTGWTPEVPARPPTSALPITAVPTARRSRATHPERFRRPSCRRWRTSSICSTSGWPLQTEVSWMARAASPPSGTAARWRRRPVSRARATSRGLRWSPRRAAIRRFPSRCQTAKAADRSSWTTFP